MNQIIQASLCLRKQNNRYIAYSSRSTITGDPGDAAQSTTIHTGKNKRPSGLSVCKKDRLSSKPCLIPYRISIMVSMKTALLIHPRDISIRTGVVTKPPSLL